MRIPRIPFAALVLCIPFLALAKPISYVLPDDEKIEGALKPGAGMDLVQNNCAACHSLDYITTQPPHKGVAFWKTTVSKMIKAYGAPIEPTEADAIVTYISNSY
jgi:sulfite dehydrogenase (cytochrome) subunit B